MSLTVVVVVVVVVYILSVVLSVVPTADFLGELGPSVVVGAGVVVVEPGTIGSSCSNGRMFPATFTIPVENEKNKYWIKLDNIEH